MRSDRTVVEFLIRKTHQNHQVFSGRGRNMIRLAVAICVVMGAQPLCAAELTLDQQLIVACFNLRIDEVVKCLRKGANVNARLGGVDAKLELFRDRWTGRTPMTLMTESWTPLLALASSDRYPDPPAESGAIWKDSERRESLWNAIPPDEFESRTRDVMVIAHILLSHKCKLDDADPRGGTALNQAVGDGKLALANALLRFGANPNTKTGIYIDGANNTTPLHVACNSREMVQLLLDYGADGSAKDDEGRTPADWVAWDSDREFDLVEMPTGWTTVPRVVQPPENDTDP